MRSSAGSRSPLVGASFLLAAVALVALAASFALSFAVANWNVPKVHFGGAQRTAPTAPATAPAARLPEVAPSAAAPSERPPVSLWMLFAPWAYTVDALALLGFVAVLLMVRGARRRRAGRT